VVNNKNAFAKIEVYIIIIFFFIGAYILDFIISNKEFFIIIFISLVAILSIHKNIDFNNMDNLKEQDNFQEYKEYDLVKDKILKLTKNDTFFLFNKKPKEIENKLAKKCNNCNSINMKFEKKETFIGWTYTNKNGTPDKRRKNNPPLYNLNTIWTCLDCKENHINK
jgi:hypothetical protein